MKKFWILTALLLVIGIGASTNAQTIATKPFVELQGTYTEITGTNVCTPAGYHDDESYTVALPFTFVYNGVSYTSTFFTTNGYIVFNNNYPYAYYMPPLNCQNYGLYLDILSIWGDDLHGNYQGTMTYAVSGSAPNRVMTFQWKDWMTYYGVGDRLNMQIKLYETSNMIEYVFGTITNPSAGTQSMTVGIASQYPGDIQNRIGAWVGSTGSTNGATYKNYSATNMPPSGYIYRFGCYVPQGSASISLVDAQGNPAGYYTTPGMAYVNYMVSYPPDEAYDVTIALNFYRIGDNSGQPAFTETFTVHKPIGTLTGMRALNLNLPPAYYRVEATFSMWNNCLMYEDVEVETSTLFIAAGTVLCEVWPGDVNNDMVVNYTDRRDLNEYIHDANLSPLWLNGPARFKIEGASNPMAYLAWEPQPSIPWNTQPGCYMDTDGNGVVNNFDYIAIKLNWARTHGLIPAKSGSGLAVTAFDMEQNFPNPFNPSTSIRYSVPENSQVTLVVTDMLGRTVSTLVSGNVEQGVHVAQFDASNLPSGNYIATVSMTGLESGLTFSKTIKMLLAK